MDDANCDIERLPPITGDHNGKDMASEHIDAREVSVVAPFLGRRFSGINASMLSVLPEQAKRIRIAAMGFHIPESIPRISVWQFCRDCWRNRWRVWHARRNIDMLAGLILRYVFRFKLILAFTSAAQRTHSWITGFCIRHMDGLIATSAAAASFLDREVVVVPHGVNVDLFSPPADRSAAWASRELPGKYGIGLFGRIRAQKGTEEFVDSMIRVLPQRPEWTAVIIGETTPQFRNFERRLRAKIRNAGLADRIHFTGFLQRFEDIPEWYRALSIVVCPSRNEGFGLSCLEAMASGCPVVATRAGAWPELITDGVDGYLVPCADTNGLAEALAKITEDPLCAHRMGQKTRAKVARQYVIKNEADGIQAVYRELFAKRGIVT